MFLSLIVLAVSVVKDPVKLTGPVFMTNVWRDWSKSKYAADLQIGGEDTMCHLPDSPHETHFFDPQFSIKRRGEEGCVRLNSPL